MIRRRRQTLILRPKGAAVTNRVRREGLGPRTIPQKVVHRTVVSEGVRKIWELSGPEALRKEVRRQRRPQRLQQRLANHQQSSIRLPSQLRVLLHRKHP